MGILLSVIGTGAPIVAIASWLGWPHDGSAPIVCGSVALAHITGQVAGWPLGSGHKSTEA